MTADLEALRLIRDLYHAVGERPEDLDDLLPDTAKYLRAHCPCPAEDRVDRSAFNRTYPFYCGICGEARPAPVRPKQPIMIRPKL